MFPEFGLVPLSLAIDFSAYENDRRHVAAFRGRSGWLLMAKATIQSQSDLLRERIVVACTDEEEIIPSWRARHITQCPWSHLDYCDESPPEILDDLLCEEEGALFARWQRSINSELATLHAQVQQEIEQLEARTANRHRQIERQILDLRRRRRQCIDEDTRRIFSELIEQLDAESDAIVSELSERRKTIRRRIDDIEESLWSRTDFVIEVEPTRLVHWRDGYPTPDHKISRKWVEGRFYPSPLLRPTSEPVPSVALNLVNLSKAEQPAKPKRSIGEGAETEPGSRVIKSERIGTIAKKQSVADLKKQLAKKDYILASLRSVLAQTPEYTGRYKRIAHKIATTEKQKAKILSKIGHQDGSTKKTATAKATAVVPSSPGAAEGLIEEARNLLLAQLEALEAKGKKFFNGSRKFEKNRLERAALEEQIVELYIQKARSQNAHHDSTSEWTLERVTVLRHFWAKGMPAAAIGQILGGTSRNSVIGKAKRLGLPFASNTVGATSNQEDDNESV